MTSIFAYFCRSKVLNVVYPFNPNVWILFTSSLFVFSVGFMIISKVEGKLMKRNLKEWNTFYEAFWYAYGTFIGEAVTRDTKSDKTYALRIAMYFWIPFCMLMAFGYCGTLRSFLITPKMNPPITTLNQVRNTYYRIMLTLHHSSRGIMHIKCLINFLVDRIGLEMGIWNNR